MSSPSASETPGGIRDVLENHTRKRKRTAPKTVNPAACSECRQSKVRSVFCVTFWASRHKWEPDVLCCSCVASQQLTTRAIAKDAYGWNYHVRKTHIPWGLAKAGNRIPTTKKLNSCWSNLYRRILDLEEQVKRLSNIATPTNQPNDGLSADIQASTLPGPVAGAVYISAVPTPGRSFIEAAQLNDNVTNKYIPNSIPCIPELVSLFRQPARLGRSLGRIELDVNQIDALFTLYVYNLSVTTLLSNGPQFFW